MSEDRYFNYLLTQSQSKWRLTVDA